jgi:hypothetical protein
MKTYRRFLTLAAAALLPFAAIATDDACCDDKDKKSCECCAEEKNDAAKESAFAAPPPAPAAAELSEADRKFLASYEAVRAALASDNVDAARKAAAEIEGGEPVAKAKTIADARVAFKALSARAIAKAKGHAGFHVAHCPMVKGGGADWLATKKAIENPYYGSAMFSCGFIKE